MANETNDLKRISILVLIAIPAIASVNINCNGKAFYCVNSTHFMICVDLGGGLSTTIDDFVIPCPATTVCQRNNIFECEFPKIEETLPLHVIGVEKQSDISEPTLVTNSVTDPTPTSDTVSVLNDTILTTARPDEDLVFNATVVENNNKTTEANNVNVTVINFQTTPNIIDSANEIIGKQSNNKPNNSLRINSVTDKSSSEIYVKNATNSSSTDNSKSADATTTTIECIISKPTTDLSSVRTAPTTDVFTSSDNLDENNSTTDKLNTPSQIVPSDIVILSSEVNAPVVNTYNKTSIQTDVASQNAMILNTKRNTTIKLLVDNHANTTPHADVLINSLEALHQNINTVIASPSDPARGSIASNVNNTKIDNLTENISDSKTFISTGRSIVDTVNTVNIARTTVTNNEIDSQNSINEYSTTYRPDIINTVHSKATETNNLPLEFIPADSNTKTTENDFSYLEKVDSNLNDSQYVASTSPPIDVSNTQNELNENINFIDIPITVVNKPLLQTDTVNLTLDKKYFISESVILPPNVKNISIDDNSNVLRVREQTLVSVLNSTLPTNKSNSVSSLKDNSDLLIDLQLGISNNDKIDISKEKGISNIHVFVDEVINTGTANTPDNNKTVQNFNPENNLNDGELKSKTESLTSVMSDELDHGAVHGAVPGSQITNTDKTVVPLVEEFNINGTQTVFSTSSQIDISAFQNKIPENITEIVNLTLDKNDFVPKSVPSTINDTGILRAREITVFESEPRTTPLSNDIHVFGSSKDNNRNISIDQKQNEYLNFKTENKYLNKRVLKNNTERSTPVVSIVPTQAVNGVVPSVQITEIDKTSVPVVQFNTIQNVPIATTYTVLGPNDNSMDNFASSFSLIAKPEIMHSDVVNDNNVESSSITNKQLIKETNAVHLIPTSINLVSEPVGVGTSVQTESENMAFPLTIDQLNASFIPNVEITTVPIDYTDKINQTDYILKSEIVGPTTDTTSVLLAVELDSTNMQNVPHATPQALALAPRETSSFDIQANPSILTKAVTSERSVLTTKPVSIFPIEIDNVNVEKHVIPVSNDFTSKFTTKKSDISSKRGSGIITDIVEMNPINTEAVLSTTPSLNQIAEIAYTNNFHAIADETITQKPILETLKNVLEKPIVPIGIGASEVFDTSLKTNNNAEQNPKTNTINIFEFGTNLDHSVPAKTEFVLGTVTVHPDIITNTEDNASSGIITVSAQDPFISPINVATDNVHNISQKPMLPAEHFIITTNSIPFTESSVEAKNVIGKPMLLVENISQTMPVITNEVNEPIVVNLLSTDDKTINNSMGGQNLLELKSTNENYSQKNLVPENSTDHLTSTQIFPSEILTIGVPHTDLSTIDQVTKLETSYNEIVNNIPEKLQPANIAITATTQAFTDVDQVPELLTVVSNIVDNEKNKSSVLIEGKSIQTPAITDDVNSFTAVNIQINTNNTDNTVLNAFSGIKIGELNVSGINNSQNNLEAENNNTYLISTIKLTELSQSMPNTLSVNGSTDNVATTIVQESEPFIIKSDNGNGTINTAVFMDKLPKINKDMQHPFVEQNLPQQNPINENNSQSNLESGNNGDHVRPTISDFIAESNIVQKNSPLGINFVSLGLEELNISDSQITKPETTYNVDNNSEKSTPSIEHFLITANSRPSTESTVGDKLMLLAENISKKVNKPIILNLQSTADTINNGMSDQNLSELKSTNENYSQKNLVPENSTDHLTSTQIFPSEILTTIGVPHTDLSTIDQVTKLETSYNEIVNNIPEKLQPVNIAITATTQPFTDVTSAMVNNIVATMDQVPGLLTVVSNIVDNEKNKSSVLIEGKSKQTPATTDEVNSSTAVNIQINTNNTDKTVLNAFSDINLGELNVSGIYNSRNNLVAENNNTYLISTIKLTELSQSMPNTLSVKGSTDNVATTIVQEPEPFIIKKDYSNGTINTVILMDKFPKINNDMQHPFADQNTNNGQNDLESQNNGDHVSATTNDFISHFKIVKNHSQSAFGTDSVPLRLEDFLSDSMLNHTVVNLSSDNPQSVIINMVPGNVSIITDNVTTLADQFSLPVTAHLDKVDNGTVTSVLQTEKSNYGNFATPVEMYNSIIINSIEKSINSYDGQNINGENKKTRDLVLDTKKLDLLTMDSKKLSGTDLDVDNVNSFIDNASTAINHDMVTQNILNKPLSTDASNTNEPIATEINPIQAPETTTIEKISQFNCTTSGTNDVGITVAPTDKTFTESGKITNIATSAITSKNNIPSDLIDGNAVYSQPLQIAATGSPKLLTISTNYDTTSTPLTGQSLDTTTNNKPTEIQNIKTVVNNPIAVITTEVKTKNNSIDSNNSSSSLDVNTTPLPPETSFISLPVPTANVQEFIKINTPTDLIDSENKTIVSIKQLDNLDNVNLGSISNTDTWSSTGQIIVQSNINTPTSTVAENSTLNNLNDPQNENTFSGSENTPTTLTKAISSHYHLGAINNKKTGTVDVKTTNPSLTYNPEIVNIQQASTPDHIIKTTIQYLDTLKQLNTPSAVTVTETSFVPPTLETLTKHLIQNKVDLKISDQKLISVEQNSDKGIPTANPTASIHDSNTDEKIKIVSTYNTVNSLNTVPTATLQLSSPSISKYYVEDTSQTQSPSVSVTTTDFDLNKTSSIKEYIENLVKRLHIVPAVETKQRISNILSTSGINTTSNRDFTFTTTLLSNSFDRDNLTHPYYITKKIVNNGTPNNVFTINSKNIPYFLKTDQLQSGFTSGSTLPADSLSKDVVYGPNTLAKSLISESPVLTTKVNNIPKIVLDRMKQFSTLNPFVTSGSGPIQRFVINSNTHVPQLVNLIKSRLSSPQYVISNVNKDPLVITDSNIESIIESPKSDTRLETIIFTKVKASEPYAASKISKGFRRSYDDSKDVNNVTSVQNVDSGKQFIGPISNNNTQDTDANSIKLVDMNGADTVNYHLENGGKGSKDNVESAKVEEKERTEKISISKDSNKPLDFQLRPKISTKYSPGAIESVAPQGNSQTEALMHNLENKTDNGSVNIAKRNSTINDIPVDLTSNHMMVTKYVQSYLNKDGKQGNKTSDELRLNESSLRRANSANVQLNASSIVKSIGTESLPAFNCTARGRYADKKDCRKFYTCIGNLQPIMGTCPNNTVFSEINKQCTRNLSHCVRNNQFRCLLEGRFSDFFKDNVYYICVKNCTNHFTRYKLQCQDGYHLNKESVKCERDEEVSTQSASSVSEVSNDESTTPKTKSEKIITFDDFECEKVGNFAYAKDCRKYYACTKVKDVYRRKIKKCTNDEVYDKKKRKCVDSDSREC